MLHSGSIQRADNRDLKACLENTTSLLNMVLNDNRHMGISENDTPQPHVQMRSGSNKDNSKTKGRHKLNPKPNTNSNNKYIKEGDKNGLEISISKHMYMITDLEKSTKRKKESTLHW